MRIGYFLYIEKNNEETELYMRKMLDILNEFHLDNVYSEPYDRWEEEKPILSELKKMAKKGDIFFTPEIRTMVNTMKDLKTIEEWRQDAGVDIVFLKEGIDTRTEEGRKIISLFQTITEIIEEEQERNIKYLTDMMALGILPKTDLADTLYDACKEHEDQRAFDAELESLQKAPDPMRADNVIPIQKRKPSAKKKNGKKPDKE